MPGYTPSAYDAPIKFGFHLALPRPSSEPREDPVTRKRTRQGRRSLRSRPRHARESVEPQPPPAKDFIVGQQVGPGIIRPRGGLGISSSSASVVSVSVWPLAKGMANRHFISIQAAWMPTPSETERKGDAGPRSWSWPGIPHGSWRRRLGRGEQTNKAAARGYSVGCPEATAV